MEAGSKGAKAEAFSLIPRGPLAELARLYNAGAEKYEPNNWRKGYAWSLSANALERHYAAWLGGQTFDQETGCHHLAAVAFHAFALIEFAWTHPEHDDLHEFEGPATDRPIREQLLDRSWDRYAYPDEERAAESDVVHLGSASAAPVSRQVANALAWSVNTEGEDG